MYEILTSVDTHYLLDESFVRVNGYCESSIRRIKHQLGSGIDWYYEISWNLVDDERKSGQGEGEGPLFFFFHRPGCFP